jgi:hypothetical protein
MSASQLIESENTEWVSAENPSAPDRRALTGKMIATASLYTAIILCRIFSACAG